VLRSVDVYSEGLNGGEETAVRVGGKKNRCLGRVSPSPLAYSLSLACSRSLTRSLFLSLSRSLSLSRNTSVRSVWILGLFLRRTPGPSTKKTRRVCRTFLKVYMELGSYFLFLQEQIKDIIIIICLLVLI